VDAIVDIVGSCAALDMLGVGAVRVGPLPLGTGTLTCEHGILPVPAPATVEILGAHPVVQTDEPAELVTPTGAALLMTWKELAGSDTDAAKAGTIQRVGYGLGHKALKTRPNCLRGMLVESRAGETAPEDACVVLECNLDDTVPELLGSLCQRLMEKGALDVFTTPVQMKKQRPGTLLTVLCLPSDREPFVEMIFAETTTFGIRHRSTQRTVLDRRHADVETPYGTVRVKIGSWQGKDITHAPEHEDCVRCAREHSVPVRTVYEAALRAR
jgi:uncharacterized protein (TIGR00299 family) protein